MRNNILKTINLHEQFKFKPKNLIIYLVEVEYLKVKEKTQNCQVQVLKKKMQDIREIKKKVQPKKKTETSQNLIFFYPTFFLFILLFVGNSECCHTIHALPTSSPFQMKMEEIYLVAFRGKFCHF
jgi:hypothetical protein